MFCKKTKKMKKTILALYVASTTLMTFAQETYTLTSESVLTVDGTSTIHDWTVTANTIQGSLSADQDILKEILFEVAVEGIISERGATMDKKTHNALKKGEHPKVIFSVQKVDVSNIENQNIIGRLNIAGVEKEVAIPSNITRSVGEIKIKGEKEIKLQDYGIEPPTAMFGSIIVGDMVIVKFDLVFNNN